MTLSMNSRGLRGGSAIRNLMHAGAFLLCATPVAAQAGVNADVPGEPGGLAVVVADAKDPGAIEAAARQLHSRPDRFRRAAKLYTEAAVLRGEYDPRGIENRLMAGRLFYYIGDEASAQAAMEAAAEAALAIGDVMTAASAMLDAAFIASGRGRPESVREFTVRARLLAQSPLLDAESRHSILRRIAG